MKGKEKSKKVRNLCGYKQEGYMCRIRTDTHRDTYIRVGSVAEFHWIPWSLLVM